MAGSKVAGGKYKVNAEQPNEINQQPDSDLAEPFSRIFADRAEADWAFDLLREATRHLRVTDPYDPRVAVTVSTRSGKPFLHLNFGNWLVLGFRAPGSTPTRVDIALLADRVSWDERFTSLAFERKEGEPEVRSYEVPLETIRPLTSHLRQAFEATLDFIADKFASWKRSPHWKQHNPEIIESLFDPEKRERLFATGLAEPELRYERHLTAFHHEVAEEEGMYEEDISSSVFIEDMGDIPMKTILVEALDGIKQNFQGELFDAMKNCNNKERLLVCLFFLSDLPTDRQHLDMIEENLRKIFPPSLRENKQPEDYEDFQASVVRGSLGDEDRKVKQGIISSEDSLWQTTNRGYWHITTFGNQQALQVLRREGIQVKFTGDKLVTEEDSMRNEEDESEVTPDYPLSRLADDTGFDEDTLTRWVRAIERKGQAILYGPPGTGKTFIAEGLAKHLIGGGDGFVELVQFHPAYAYEDFMQGLRPKTRSEGGLDYRMVPGRFLEFCQKAQRHNGRCVLIIDEINRANLARVFGELMYLLEYRNREVPLAGGGTLKIPDNVRLIGTMNTADRSIALVDHALRRRFAFIALQPNYDVLRQYHSQGETGFPVERLIKLLTRLNGQIEADYQVGITFFLNKNLTDEIEDIWRMEIEPYLEEYFFDQRSIVDDYRWDEIKPEILPK